MDTTAEVIRGPMLKWGRKKLQQMVLPQNGRQVELQALTALSGSGRQAEFRRRMTTEITTELSQTDDTIPMEMIDARCQLRHNPKVSTELRRWVRNIDQMQRATTGVLSPTFTGSTYQAVFTKICLAMTSEVSSGCFLAAHFSSRPLHSLAGGRPTAARDARF